MTRCALFCLITLIAQQTGAQVTPKAIPDEPSCPRCTVTTRTLVTLGTEDGLGSLNGRPMSVNADSKGRYWVFQELEPPTVFSATGAADRMVGRKGSGPGEFQSANNGIAVGDSMLVFDWLSSRATMIGPDLKAGRTIRAHRSLNDPLVVEWPRLVITAGYVEGSDPPNSALHRVDFSGEESKFAGSFGPRGSGGSMGNAAVGQRIALSRSGLWSVYWTRPEVTHWSRQGVAIRSFERQPNWYPTDAMPSMGTPTKAPTPRVAEISEDAEGLVWLFYHRPAETWKDAWPAGSGRGDIRTRDLAWNKLYYTYVEVIDPVQARLITSHTINGYVFDALPDRKIALYQVDLAGIPRVQIVSLSLNGR